jgi:hypothetical protein
VAGPRPAMTVGSMSRYRRASVSSHELAGLLAGQERAGAIS